MMKNQVLSIEQMKHLKELGVHTNNASMCWVLPTPPDYKRKLDMVGIHGNLKAAEERGHSIGAFTLQDMLEIISTVEYESDGFPIFMFLYNYRFKCWEPRFRNPNEFDNPDTKSNSPLEAAYLMLCWLAENGYLKNKEE